MNEMLSSSIWPNFTTSRQNSNDQFSLDAMSAWQPIKPASELYPTEDYNNVWSEKCEANEENQKDSFIKSIWSANASPTIITTETNSTGSGELKLLEETPTNSPSLKRIEIINCNDLWGRVIINQLMPWKIIEIEESDQRPHDPMVWRAKVDGTEVWEEYYLKQHGRRRPQADSSFNSDSVWSLASDLSQSTNSIWPPKNNDVSIASNETFCQNTFTDVNNRSYFNLSNSVRPSMTRNQAQKYLIDMGYSLSDAIGALVNNQMDLPKAINELQSKYRIPTTTLPTTTHNGMYTQTVPYNSNRPTDSVNTITRTPSASSMISQNNGGISAMIGSNYSNNYDMFHSDLNEHQILDSPYINMESSMSPFGRVPDSTKRQFSFPIGRDNSYRNSFPANVLNNNNNGGGGGNNSRTMSNNCGGGQYSDMSVLGQGMARMNMNFNNAGPAMMSQNNKWSSSCNSNGYNGMHNNSGGGGNNGNNAMLNHNTNNANTVDMRQNFTTPTPSALGRSISKQQVYGRSTPGFGWHSDASSSFSSNGPLTDINPARLAKNLSCPGFPENSVGIIIRKVPPQHIEIVKSICFESGAMTNFQLQPHIQSIIVYFNSGSEAHRCMSILQSQINARVELINDDYMYCMPGAN